MIGMDCYELARRSVIILAYFLVKNHCLTALRNPSTNPDSSTKSRTFFLNSDTSSQQLVLGHQEAVIIAY